MRNQAGLEAWGKSSEPVTNCNRLKLPAAREEKADWIIIYRTRHRGQGVAAWGTFAGHDDEEYIYTLFKTAGNLASESQEWNGDTLLVQIESFESDVRNKPVANVGRTSPYPRILPLRDVLRAKYP